MAVVYNGGKFCKFMLNDVDGRCAVVSTKIFSRIRRIVVKQTNSNWGTFNMFNIIETPRNYFTRELLHDNLSSNVALHLLQHNVAYCDRFL